MTEPLAKDYATPQDYAAADDKWKANRTYRNSNRDDHEVSDLDFSRIGMLLKIIEMAVLHGPAFTNIIAEANFELLDFNTRALEFSTSRAKAKADAEAKAKADEQARADELAAEQEAKLKAEAQQKIDDEIRTKAQVLAAAQAKAEADVKAKAEADAKAGKPVAEPVPVVEPHDTSKLFPPDHVTEPLVPTQPEPFVAPGPEATFPTDNGRRL